MRIGNVVVTLAAAIALQGCGGPGFGRGGPPGFGPPGAGMPGPSGPSRELQLRRFDADANGNITKSEFDNVLGADFATADKNGDGRLGAEETRAFNAKEKPSADVSPVFDWNADGAVSIDEFAAQWRTLFNRADADADGTVTAEELTRPPISRAGRPPGGGPPGGGPPGGPGGGGRGGRPGGSL